jgi:hypothetical protein
MFSFWKNPVEKCTQSFSWCNINRGKVTSLRLLVSPPAASSIITQVPHLLSLGSLVLTENALQLNSICPPAGDTDVTGNVTLLEFDNPINFAP